MGTRKGSGPDGFVPTYGQLGPDDLNWVTGPTAFPSVGAAGVQLGSYPAG
ncbi:hypothetical protein GCM10023107_11110 [Actinoplanes octamycinicus]